MYSLATPLKKKLERFFLTKAEFEALDLLLDKFKMSIPEKRVATGISKVSTANIQETFKAIDLLLKEELDSLMLPFQFVEEDFYDEYKSARIIIDYSGRSHAMAEEIA